MNAELSAVLLGLAGSVGFVLGVIFTGFVSGLTQRQPDGKEGGRG